MAMTGMRVMTVNLGLVEETPPRAILRQRVVYYAPGAEAISDAVATEIFHWTYGAGGGAAFAALPETVAAPKPGRVRSTG